jgi:hypothetical protein
MNYIEPFHFHGTSLHAGYTEQDVVREARKRAQKLVERFASQP